MDTHVRLVKVQQDVVLVVEAGLLGVVRRLEQRRRGVKIRDDDVGLTRAAILELVTDVRGVLELLLDGTGARAELFANRSLGAHRLPVARLITDGSTDDAPDAVCRRRSDRARRSSKARRAPRTPDRRA